MRDTNESPATRTANFKLPSLSFLPFSPLERVLLIQETIGMIMDDLSPRALLNLGMSCRALYEPAMDRLWRTLPSLGRLLLCLPEELVEAVTARQVGHTLVSLLWLLASQGSLPIPTASYQASSRTSPVGARSPLLTPRQGCG